MSTLREDMDADLAEIFLDEDEHAEPATYKPRGAAEAFACTVLRTATQPAQGGEPGFGPTAPTRLLVSRAALRAGIQAQLGTVRDPAHGDIVTLTRSGEEGAVTVVEPGPTDAWHLSVSFARLDALTVQRRTS